MLHYRKTEGESQCHDLLSVLSPVNDWAKVSQGSFEGPMGPIQTPGAVPWLCVSTGINHVALDQPKEAEKQQSQLTVCWKYVICFLILQGVTNRRLPAFQGNFELLNSVETMKGYGDF